MRLAQRGKKTQKNLRPVYETSTVPAPVRGLNFREALSQMKPTDALRLDNIICRPSALEVRKGQVELATGFTSPVETLFGYVNVNGSVKLFAAAGFSIFDASSSGAIGAAVVTGLTSAYWNHTQLSNVGGNYLIAVNGQDNGQIYDGTSWAVLGFTGLAITAMTQVAVWKRRVWVVEKNSFRAWYGAADAITGALTQFSFAGIFRKGGRLQAIINWTIDGGAGSDDYLIAVTSMGEVAVYKGTDPALASTFALVGVYFIGPPIGERFYTPYGGDVLMLTAEGLFPISKYLQSQTVDKTTALTDRISSLISSEVSTYGTVRGWEVHVFLDDNFILLQVPAGGIGSRYQYAMSLLNGGWSRFLVTKAVTWLAVGNTLYEGEANRVCNGWAGGTDTGEPIPFTIVPAFSYFGSPARNKIFALGRCLMESEVPLRFVSKLLSNFDQSFFFPPLSPAGLGSNLWDLAIWDSGITTTGGQSPTGVNLTGAPGAAGAVWGASRYFTQSWYSLSGMGYSATQVIYGVSIATQTRILTLDYTFEPGGLL